MSSDTKRLEGIIARLDATTAASEQAARKLASELAEARLLSAEDRIQISRLILLNRQLLDGLDILMAAADRIELTAVHVAEDLAASIERADKAPAETPGAGADAALRSPGETSAQAASHAEEPT